MHAIYANATSAGEGLAGIVVPGCDGNETIVHFKKGEVIATPPGIPFWAYNYGKEQVIAISVGVTNSANQLLAIPQVSLYTQINQRILL